ncbi:MAG: hypothetical protein COU73_03030 [Parcubacteria group bacterium CG10_big_fil_rev_8_21_14_0_10_46_32]|nr:MAG: hypothetical protein COU73_03030 [Parcubacteria group bacterium CG10_big_fil_rev_8_21_14_0_10_46_32]
MKTFFATIFILCLFVGAVPAQAVNGINQLKNNLGAIGTGTGLGTQGDTNITQKIAAIVNIALSFLGMLAVIIIIYAGFKWMTAGGNDDQVKEARDNIRNAVIGIAIIMLSYILINFVVGKLSSATGVGGGGDGGSVISGPQSCVYDFIGCNQLCIDISNGSCSSTYPWPACASDTTGSLSNQIPGLCSTTCPNCSSP